MRVHPRCADAHNCLGPTLGRWCFLRLYICSSASPRVAAFGLGCWNCSKGGYLNWHQDLWPWWNLEVWGDAGYRMLCLARHNSEIFCFGDFFLWRDGTWRTNKGTDRLFSENIILDMVWNSQLMSNLTLTENFKTFNGRLFCKFHWSMRLRTESDIKWMYSNLDVTLISFSLQSVTKNWIC